MIYYTVRVELNESHREFDFTRLHHEMEKEGFSKALSFEGEETVYQLPATKYNKHDYYTTIRVLESAMKAVASTGKKFSVFVTQGENNRELHNFLEW
jgi:lipoate synthase